MRKGKESPIWRIFTFTKFINSLSGKPKDGRSLMIGSVLVQDYDHSCSRGNLVKLVNRLKVIL